MAEKRPARRDGSAKHPSSGVKNNSGKSPTEGRPASPPRTQLPESKQMTPNQSKQSKQAQINPPPPSGCFCFGRKQKPPPSSPAAKKREINGGPNNKQVSGSAPSRAHQSAARKVSKSQENKPAATKTAADLPTTDSRSPLSEVNKAHLMESNGSLSPRDTEIIPTTKRPHKEASTPNSSGGNGRLSPAGKTDSELDSYINNVDRASARGTARVATSSGSGRELVDRSVVGASMSSGFAEYNKMFDMCGIRFDRSQVSGTGESTATVGDQHLCKLEEACRQLIQKVHPESKHRLSRSESSTSGATMNSSMRSMTSASSSTAAAGSLTLPSQLPSSSSQTSSTAAAPAVPSAKFVEISMTMTEVLQLQCRPKEAVTVLSRAIDEVNADMTAIRVRKEASKTTLVGVISRVHANNTYDIDISDGGKEIQVLKGNIQCDGPLRVGAKVKLNKNREAPSPEEYEQLRKLKAACHRRIGSLYVSYKKYKEAEDHILKYMSYLEKNPVSVSQKNEVAYTCSVLACIYDQLGRAEEAAKMDFQAIEVATEARTMDLNVT